MKIVKIYTIVICIALLALTPAAFTQSQQRPEVTRRSSISEIRPGLESQTAQGVMRQGGKQPAIRQERISSSEITRLERGVLYEVDLTRHGVIYDFDFTTGPVDLSRVKLREASRSVLLRDWLPKRLPPSVRREWTSGHVRIGWPQDFLFLWGKRPRPYHEGREGVTPYDCAGPLCVCHGEDDCVDMYREGGPCTSNGWCDESGDSPTCICFTNGAEATSE